MPLGAFKLNGISKYTFTEVTGKTVTIVGGKIDSGGKIGKSYYNPAGASWIEIAQHSDFAFGTSQDFTVEGWIWFGSTINDKYLFDGRPDNNSLAILMDGAYLKVYIAGAYRISSGITPFQPNTWNHIAYTRQGTTGTLWLNGASVGTWTDTTNYTHNNSLKLMSRYVFGQGSQNSFLDEFRISKVARYTGAFTPTTTGFSGDSDTICLLHFDNQTGARTPVTVIAAGYAQMSNVQSKFGGTSCFLDGNSDYLQLSEGLPGTFNFGTGDYTVEMWVYPITLSSDQKFLDLRSASDANNGTNANGRNWLFDYTTTLRLYENGAARITGGTLSTGSWQHIAVSRQSGSTRMFINGTQVGSTYSSSYDLTKTALGTPAIGSKNGSAANFFNGYIDEVRISNTARYTANFTPATARYTNDSSTMLLLHMDGMVFNNNFVDDYGATTVDQSSLSYSSPGAGSAVGFPATNISLSTYLTSSSQSMTLPTFTGNVAPGDIAILVDCATQATDVTPVGWTAISNIGSSSTIRTNISYKILSPIDSGATIVGMATGTRKQLFVFKPNYPAPWVWLSTPGAQATTATPTNQTINGSGASGYPQIYMAVYASTGSTFTRGYTGGAPLEYSMTAVAPYVYVKYEIVTASAPTRTISMSDGGTNTLQSFWLRLS